MSISLMPIKGKIMPPKPQIRRFLRNKASAPRALYLTPLKATGIRTIMMRALKITADNMAEVGEYKCMISILLATAKNQQKELE